MTQTVCISMVTVRNATYDPLHYPLLHEGWSSCNIIGVSNEATILRLQYPISTHTEVVWYIWKTLPELLHWTVCPGSSRQLACEVVPFRLWCFLVTWCWLCKNWANRVSLSPSSQPSGMKESLDWSQNIHQTSLLAYFTWFRRTSRPKF